MATRTITIFSNKGGVGKTFVSVNLATTLAMSGARVLLMDMDFQAVHDMSRMLNIVPKHSLADLLSKIDKVENPEEVKKFVVTHNCGLDFLPGVLHVKQAGLISAQNLKPLFKRINELYDYIIVDGPHATPSPVPQTPIIRGDAKSPVIAAASIMAKVVRDAIMHKYHTVYPQYNFARNKGYGTREHLNALALHGCCPIHRKSFKKVLSD